VQSNYDGQIELSVPVMRLSVAIASPYKRRLNLIVGSEVIHA